MVDLGSIFDGEDALAEVDWESFLNELSDVSEVSRSGPLTLGDSLGSSPESVSSLLGQFEKYLMEDDDEDDDHQRIPQEPPQQQHELSAEEDFLADILVDSPHAVEVVIGAPALVSDVVVDGPTDNDSGASDSGSLPSSVERKDKDKKNKKNKVNVHDDGADTSNDSDPDDPSSKKRKRQLRNRDAAVRSRERKKLYVRDLEMKSKYHEGECRRLGRLLQCLIAENQALRLSLQKGNAFGVNSAKQESAVLLLESLLLGSLLWFLVIICMFTLPPQTQSTLVVVPPESVGKKAAENVAPRGSRSRMFTSLDYGRRCKASRRRMKPSSPMLLVW